MKIFVLEEYLDLFSVIGGIRVATGGLAPVSVGPMVGVFKEGSDIFLYHPVCPHISRRAFRRWSFIGKKFRWLVANSEYKNDDEKISREKISSSGPGRRRYPIFPAEALDESHLEKRGMKSAGVCSSSVLLKLLAGLLLRLSLLPEHGFPSMHPMS